MDTKSTKQHVSEQELLSMIRAQMENGQFFLAQDLAQNGIDLFPGTIEFKQLKAKAFLETGALEEARDLLEPLSTQGLLDRDMLIHTLDKLKVIFESYRNFDKKSPKWEILKGLAEFSVALAQTGEMARNAMMSDPDSLELMAQIYKRIWLRSKKPEHFDRVAQTYKHAAEESSHFHLSVHNAFFRFLRGEKTEAISSLKQILEKVELNAENASDYCLGALLSGQTLRAEKAIQLAVPFYQTHFSARKKLRQEVSLLREEGIFIPPSLDLMLKPPVIVGFTGHMIDAPKRANPRFPAFLEPRVKVEMQRILEDIGADIGYSLGASGGDIIFLETMLERGGEINLIMPFDIKDFIEASIRFAGQSWVTRFNHLLKLAHHISFATDENYLGDDDLFQFAGRMIFGQSRLRAQTLEAEPYLLALWDKKQSGLVGGTSDLINLWENKETLRIIDLEAILKETQAPKVSSIVAPYTPDLIINDKRRVVRTMLFSDVVGFSKLQESHVPGFIAFMQDVASHLQTADQQPPFINTWGDAIFAVLEKANDMARYALALKEALRKAGQKDYGLPTQLSLRIGLHAGPVYEDKDPITGRVNYYGGHVNRAARIEPVTIPGRIYASEQFISLLATEEASLKQKNKDVDFPWVYEYIGTLSLAKKFGDQKIYHLTEKDL